MDRAKIADDARARTAIIITIDIKIPNDINNGIGYNCFGPTLRMQIINNISNKSRIVKRKVTTKSDSYCCYSLCKVDSINKLIQDSINDARDPNLRVIKRPINFKELEKEIEKLEENKSNQ